MKRLADLAEFKPQFLTRFWAKVETGKGCWRWTACTDKDGYGMILLWKGQLIKAHRASWIIHNGKIPFDLHVLHSCDCPSCVNPNHLWLGTNLQNMQDKMRKGRFVQGDLSRSTGEQSYFAKLCASQVQEIRGLYATGQFTYKELALRFSVSLAQIGAIITRSAWASCP